MASAPRFKIEQCEEPEIQYAASPELFDEIRAWLASRGATAKKADGPEQESAVYYDTKNYRLLREGGECRSKDKGDCFRHDMKLPLDTRQRETVPDANDILWRNELKVKSSEAKPRLAEFWGAALLAPIHQRVHRLFDKELVPQFRTRFSKEKINQLSDEEGAKIEYSFQTGHMETLDGARRTPTLHILELELRKGNLAGLLEEKAALEAAFGDRLQLLPERKVMLGFALLEPDMSDKQRRNFTDARYRNSPQAANDIGCELAAA